MFFMVERIKILLKEKPPLVMFLVCFTISAIGMFALSRHIRVSAIEDPNETNDWNKMLQNITGNHSYWNLNGTYSDTTSLNKTLLKNLSQSSFVIHSNVHVSSEVKPKLPQFVVFESVFPLPDKESLTLVMKPLHKLNKCDKKEGECTQFLPMCLTVYGNKQVLPRTSFTKPCSEGKEHEVAYMKLEVSNITSPLVNESLVMMVLSHAYDDHLHELLPMDEKIRVENRLLICGYITTLSIFVLMLVFAFFSGDNEKHLTPAHQPLTS